MAYEPTVWNDGDLITAEKLNKLEQGVKNEQVGPTGPKGDPGQVGAKGDPGEQGPAGKGVKSIALYTTDGAVTGGKVTFSDDTQEDITVTQAPGS